MSDRSTESITEVLQEFTSGRAKASDELVLALQAELRELARAMMSDLPSGHTLEPTALVREAYLRLLGDKDPGWEGRGHFLGAAARAVRRILLEQAHRKSATRGGEVREHINADDVLIRIEAPDADMSALDAALDRLERSDPRSAQVVHLRYFAGLTTEETADTMGLPVSTVERDWQYARTLLHFQLTEGAP